MPCSLAVRINTYQCTDTTLEYILLKFSNKNTYISERSSSPRLPRSLPVSSESTKAENTKRQTKRRQTPNRGVWTFFLQNLYFEEKENKKVLFAISDNCFCCERVMSCDFVLISFYSENMSDTVPMCVSDFLDFNWNYHAEKKWITGSSSPLRKKLKRQWVNWSPETAKKT